MVAVALTADRRTRVRVYLNDHLARAAAGLKLAQRCRKNNRGTPLAGFLDQLIVEMREDKATLESLMQRMGLQASAPKQALAEAVEFLGRYKLNGQLRGYSPLGRLVELEGLCTEVEAKHSMWVSLVEIADVQPTLRDIDLDKLISRAIRQREGLEGQRRAAARVALAQQP